MVGLIRVVNGGEQSGNPAFCSRVMSEPSLKPHRRVSTVTPTGVGTVKLFLVPMRYEPSFFCHATLASPSALVLADTTSQYLRR